jgi:hypothetical protein
MAESNVRPACLSTSKPLPPLPSSSSPQDGGLSNDGGDGKIGEDVGEPDILDEQNSPDTREKGLPRPPEQRPDYILTAAYMLVYLEIAWLILWLFRSL